MMARFHQRRGASFLIACVISSRGTHCIKSLIQQAAKGPHSDALHLLLISSTALTLPQGLYPVVGLVLEQRVLGGEPRCQRWHRSRAFFSAFSVTSYPPCSREGRQVTLRAVCPWVTSAGVYAA